MRREGRWAAGPATTERSGLRHNRELWARQRHTWYDRSAKPPLEVKQRRVLVGKTVRE